MKWNIVADSSCDIFELESQNEQIDFSTVPFVISVDNKDYIDDENINLDEMIDQMYLCKEASKTACPSPDSWYKEFSKEGNVIAITITSGLSGSYNSAIAARETILEDDPNKNIEIIDSLSTGPELILIIRKLNELITSGKDFKTVIKEIKLYQKTTHILFALSSFDNLVKNGRMNKLAGFVAHKLGLIGIGMGSEKGTISMKQIVRGKKKALSAIMNNMKNIGINGNQIVITHCQNLEYAKLLKEKIEETWNNIQVTIRPTRGLCSYYAERYGLIIAF